jgi:hypothetical protein
MPGSSLIGLDQSLDVDRQYLYLVWTYNVELEHPPIEFDPISAITRPSRLWSRAEVLARPSVVPCEPGVYGWYFSRTPLMVPTANCLTCGDCTLLYVGISPKLPQKAGAASAENLSTRVRYHMRGNAEGSTLRLTLGCLLENELRIQLRRVGSGKRMTFAAGEAALSAWMEANALVCWAPCAQPWVVEEQLIATVSLPLSLDQNRNHTFHAKLSAIRRDAKRRARELPCLQSC